MGAVDEQKETDVASMKNSKQKKLMRDEEYFMKAQKCAPRLPLLPLYCSHSFVVSFSPCLFLLRCY